MFKKQFKVSNSHAMAGKDKKKLKEQLVKLNYDTSSVEVFLDDKIYGGEEVMLDKLQGSKIVLLSRGKVPLMFSTDQKAGIYYPTIYLLFQLEKLPYLRVYLKQGVEQYIFNGADLMWPGIKSINNEEFKTYDIAVIYAKNNKLKDDKDETYVPIAVGKMLTSKIPSDLKGRSMQVEHYIYDELWNYGPKKIPEEIAITKDENVKLEEDQSKEEAKSENNQEEEKKESEENKNEESKEEEKISQSDQAEEEDSLIKIPVEDMDARIIEAFYRCFFESIKDTDLPMEPSDFQRDHLNLYSAPEYKLDLKLSSYKRVILSFQQQFQIGKLLEVMHKQGIIEYSEVKGISHNLITKVHREKFNDYKPQFSLKKKKAQTTLPTSGDGALAGYPKILIEQVWLSSKHLNAVFGNVKDIKLKDYYTMKECREILEEYIKQQNLDQKKGVVRIDPILTQILPQNFKGYNEIPKEAFFKSINGHVQECYQVTNVVEDEITNYEKSKVFKGPAPKVLLKAQRVRNKKGTFVNNLDIYQIDYEELVPYLSSKCSCSVTLHEIEGRKGVFQLFVQGQQLDLLEEILTKRYKVPKQYIEKQNLIEKKKKGKK